MSTITTITTFCDLRVWQAGMELAAEGQSSEHREEYQRHVAVAYQSTAALQTKVELAGAGRRALAAQPNVNGIFIWG